MCHSVMFAALNYAYVFSACVLYVYELYTVGMGNSNRIAMSDMPIAIGLRKNSRNFGLPKLLDF